MMRYRLIAMFSTLLALPLWSLPPANGAEFNGAEKLTIHPQGQAKPALRYQLLPGFMDQIPGNAAVHYGKVTAEEIPFFSNRDLRESIVRWQETPLEQLRSGDVQLPTRGKIEDELRRAARCSYCDWQLPIRDGPFYTMLLSEVQQCRDFGRILGARVRIQIAAGRIEDAIQTFQTGYALARNVADGETIVNGLVGIAICGILNHQMTTFVQQSESPNLYWALTALPSPLIDMTPAIDVERHGIELSFPELQNLESANLSSDEARRLFQHFATQVVDWISTADSPAPQSLEELEELSRQRFPTAKLELLDRGISAEALDAMPEYQITLLHTLQLHRELFDEGMKYYSLPFPQAMQGIEAAIAKAERAHEDGVEILPLSGQILRAILTARIVTVRNDRQLAVLRTIEAMRIHGAHHEGNLPETLEDISEVPIPVDPVTGQAFEYQLEGDTAILQGLGPTLRDVPLRYEISMVQPRE